jgi:hypothetical protein
LSTNKIPLCALDDYLKAFYPRIGPRAAPGFEKRLKSQYSTSGSLRIWLRKSELKCVDITRLIKHAIRFPDFTITVHSLPDMHADILSLLQTLMSNKMIRWVSAIKGNKISQARLESSPYLRGPRLFARIVVKEKHATSWMRLMAQGANAMPTNYAETLGLGKETDVWKITFGIDY